MLAPITEHLISPLAVLCFMCGINLFTATEISPRIGNNPPSSSPHSHGGVQTTYLNTEFPAERDGVVAAWHYCYYPAAMSTGRHSATVAVWRYDEVLEQYQQLGGSISILELQAGGELLANIYCTQPLLDAGNCVQIRRGDVVGLVLPSTTPIPMVGKSSEYFIMASSNDQPPLVNLSASNLVSQTLALHLYADIMKGRCSERACVHGAHKTHEGTKYKC
jgi:hypothetical protein